MPALNGFRKPSTTTTLSVLLAGALLLAASGCGGDVVEGEGLELDPRRQGSGRVFSVGFATGNATVLHFGAFRQGRRRAAKLLAEEFSTLRKIADDAELWAECMRLKESADGGVAAHGDAATDGDAASHTDRDAGTDAQAPADTDARAELGIGPYLRYTPGPIRGRTEQFCRLVPEGPKLREALVQIDAIARRVDAEGRDPTPGAQ
jgi:hypothetical protein